MPCTSAEFLCRKKWGPQRKDFGGRYGFPGVFIGLFLATTGLESFPLSAKKSSPKVVSFGGGFLCFFLLCVAGRGVPIPKGHKSAHFQTIVQYELQRVALSPI